MNVSPNRALFASLGLLGASLAIAGAQQSLQPRMGDPVPGLSQAEMDRFIAGRIEFDTLLDVADGLGPIFNDTSCGQCHAAPATGGFGARVVTRFGRKADGVNPFDPLEHLGGSLLQTSVIPGFDPDIFGEKIPAEADVIAQRITPQSFGIGLLEAIPDSQVLANVGSSPNVNGIVRWVQPVEGGPMRTSKFGWKGGVATVLHFSADASVMEMGLTNQFFPTENAPNGDLALLAIMDSVPDPEDVPDAFGVTRVDRQTDFQAFLAAPPQTPRSGMTGELLFSQIGCADCHVPSYTTGTHPSAALSNQLIRPYSDFLLHDMGHPDQGGLGDGIVDGIATESMMMTRTLWGMSQRQALLHDGRASGGTFAGIVDQAIQWHRGDASFSRDNYNNLSAADKDLLARFLGSLGRAEFDWDNNNVIDVFDWFFMEPLFTGPNPATPVTPDDDGAVADFNQDGALDLRDFIMFQRAFTGQVF